MDLEPIGDLGCGRRVWERLFPDLPPPEPPASAAAWSRMMDCRAWATIRTWFRVWYLPEVTWRPKHQVTGQGRSIYYY